MKTHLLKTFTLTIIMAALMIGMTLPVNAAYDPFKAMEDRSREAVAAAIKEGIVPPDATIYDCMYSKGEDGVTRVVQYKDKNGNWIDVSTGKKVETAEPSEPSDNTATTQKNLTPDELQAYTDKVAQLVNEKREKAGLVPLERSDYLDEAANTRATECASVNSIRVNGQPHTRPDGSRWFTVLGISKNYNYGENTGEGKNTADKQMESWMKSDEHRANILRDDYTEIGIGCAISEQGEIFAVQIFYRP